MHKPKVGLLPLYLALYDKVVPDLRAELEDFARSVSRRLERAGCQVVLASACRVKQEFSSALSRFEKDDVEGVITLHLAYSPSLEAIEALEKTELPVLVLDTTPENFGPKAGMKELLRNHGIHGVQDLTSVMLRRGRPYSIICGPSNDPALYDRAAQWARAALAARRLRNMRVGLMGSVFKGMGDFAVSEKFLASALGPRVIKLSPSTLVQAKKKVDQDALRAAIKAARACFNTRGLATEVLEDAERTYLALKAIVERRGLGAFTMNFGDMPCAPPFYAVSKIIGEGVDYAGEGDVLTATVRRLWSLFSPGCAHRAKRRGRPRERASVSHTIPAISER